MFIIKFLFGIGVGVGVGVVYKFYKKLKINKVIFLRITYQNLLETACY